MKKKIFTYPVNINQYKSSLNASTLRKLSLITYFGQNQLQVPILSIGFNTINQIITKEVPYIINWSNLYFKCISNDINDKNQYLDVLNGSLIALCTIDDQ